MGRCLHRPILLGAFMRGNNSTVLLGAKKASSKAKNGERYATEYC